MMVMRSFIVTGIVLLFVFQAQPVLGHGDLGDGQMLSKYNCNYPSNRGDLGQLSWNPMFKVPIPDKPGYYSEWIDDCGFLDFNEGHGDEDTRVYLEIKMSPPSDDKPTYIRVKVYSLSDKKYVDSGSVTYADVEKYGDIPILGDGLTKTGEYIIHVSVMYAANTSIYRDADDAEHHWSLKIGMGGRLYNESLAVMAQYAGIRDFCPRGKDIAFARAKQLELEAIRSFNGARGALTDAEYDEQLLKMAKNIHEHQNYLDMAFIDALGDINQTCDSFLSILLMKECGDDKLCGLRVLKQFR